jgi:hypothetical protein
VDEVSQDVVDVRHPVNAPTVEGHPVELVQDRAVEARSTTALLLGERGGIRWCVMPSSSLAPQKAPPRNSGPLSVSTPVSSTPRARNPLATCRQNAAATWELT